MRKRKMTPETVLPRPTSKADLDAVAARWRADQKGKKHQLLVCAGAACVSSGCRDLRDAIVVKVKEYGLQDEVRVIRDGLCRLL